eukprot:14992360-Alexandrium_andersonii.AAC.1
MQARATGHRAARVAAFRGASPTAASICSTASWELPSLCSFAISAAVLPHDVVAVGRAPFNNSWRTTHLSPSLAAAWI